MTGHRFADPFAASNISSSHLKRQIRSDFRHLEGRAVFGMSGRRGGRSEANVCRDLIGIHLKDSAGHRLTGGEEVSGHATLAG